MSAPAPAGRSGTQKQALSKILILKDYRQRLKDSIRSMRDNFREIITLARIDDDSNPKSVQVSRFTQHVQDAYEMEVRAANLARAADSLLKLVSDLKQFQILNDFTFVNKTIQAVTEDSQKTQRDLNLKLSVLREEVGSALAEIEQEYYTTSLTASSV